jgi:hypothetical protein
MRDNMKKVWVIFLLVFFLVGCKSGTAESLELFSEGLLAVEANNKWGYINNKGEIVIDLLYDDAGAFYGNAAIVEIGSKMQLINKKGQNVLDKSFDVLYRDETTFNLIYKENNKWGLMDDSGKKLTEALYDELNVFSYGLSRVRSGDLYGFIDKKGKTVVSLAYDDALSFSNGLAAVEKDGLWGYINTKGNVEIELKYLDANSFDAYGNALIENSGNLPYHIIDKDEKILMSGDYISGTGPLYGVRIGEDYYLHKADGKKFIEQKYTNLWSMSNYYANVEIDYSDDLNVWFTDKGQIFKSAEYNISDYEEYTYKGNVIEALVVEDDKYLDIHTLDKSYRLEADYLSQIIEKEQFIVEKSDKYGIIDKDGKIILEFLYDFLIKTDDGYIIFVVGEKIGFMDKSFKTILSATYDDINPTYNIYYL